MTNPQLPADLVTFTEEILNGNLHFLCSACSINSVISSLARLNVISVICFVVTILVSHSHFV